MLNEYGYETFHGSERSAVNHHGAVLLVVGACVLELEAFGKVVVDLNGSQLPATAKGVLYHEVELGTVECGFAIFDVGGETLFFAGFNDGVLCAFPIFFRTDVLFAVHFVAE